MKPFYWNMYCLYKSALFQHNAKRQFWFQLISTVSINECHLNPEVLMCSQRVNSCLSTNDSRRVTLVTNPEIIHHWGNNQKLWIFFKYSKHVSFSDYANSDIVHLAYISIYSELKETRWHFHTLQELNHKIVPNKSL